MSRAVIAGLVALCVAGAIVGAPPDEPETVAPGTGVPAAGNALTAPRTFAAAGPEWVVESVGWADAPVQEWYARCRRDLVDGHTWREVVITEEQKGHFPAGARCPDGIVRLTGENIVWNIDEAVVDAAAGA